MKYKPFLSHKRARARSVGELKRQLCVRGAGGWKDTDDLPLGGDFNANLVKAIMRETGGFIWWATMDTLASPVICELELPTALRRAKRDATYPIVPVFVELDPAADRAPMEAAIGASRVKQLLACNGIIRGPRQPLNRLAEETARSYVKQLVQQAPVGPIDVNITAFRAPTEQHQLTLDWRTLFDADTRELRPAAELLIRETLADVRDALQARARRPEVIAELSLPIPLAMLVGYEWRTTTQLKATVQTANPDGQTMLSVAATGRCSKLAVQTREARLGGSGPFVLAVSVGASLGETVERYASQYRARGFEHLHVDVDAAARPLGASDISALAASVVKKMNQLHAAGVPKHLLLRGPAALGAVIGLGANGTGQTWVPFWDGHEHYTGGVEVG